MMAESGFIETRELTKIYGDGEQVHALDGVDLAIRQGEMAAIMGPSGSGKSTLLNMLGGLDRPSGGRVLIDGQDLAAVRSLDAFRAQTVGFVFQLHNLLPALTALENVEVPMRGQPMGRRERRERARELLTLVGLPDRMDHLPSQLSGGQRQKVAIARALANRPRLILADEPTGNLDTQSGAEIMALLRRLNQELGTTVIIVTHDSAVAHHTGRILVMRDGRIVHEHAVGTAFEEDLETFLDSTLGRALLAGGDALSRLSADSRAALQRLAEGIA
jgi:ABC-type lipoprotein export system ATPase subunit